MKRGIIVISGYNMRAIIAFLRVCDNNKIPYFIIASSKSDPILSTKYCSGVSHIREDNDIEKIYDMVIDIKLRQKLDIIHILPSTEFLNRYLLKNSDKLNNAGIQIPLINIKLYEKISDKFSFAEMCKYNNISVPHIYDKLEKIKYPIILKAKSYFKYMGKPIKIDNEKEFNNFMLNYNLEDWFIQEYLYGSSYYLLYYFKKNGEHVMFSQQNFIQQMGGASIVMAKSSNIHEMQISKKYINMLKKQNFYGLIMIELRKHKEDFFMIEANPRLWGPSQLFVDSNVPIFENFLYDMGYVINSDILENRDFIDSIYYWNEGMKISNGMETYYDYDKDILLRNYNTLMEAEIYNREDTYKLFYNKKVYNDYE